ncbi:MAG: class I SAM-dependent methyltransferase [Allosphingosinicella sp.]
MDSYFEEDPNYFSDVIGRARHLLEERRNIVALDVGAGIGKAMRAMERAGFDVHGLEGSEDFRDRAIARFGIAPERIKLCDISEARFEPETFDFIAFSFVLEHLPNPNEILAKALSWVKPDGLILVEVPNSQDILARLLNFFFRFRGTNYVTNISPMHPPYHLYEFAEKSFELHGRRVGYRVVESLHYTWPFTSLPGWLDKTLQSAQKLARRPSQLRVWLQPAEAVAASS